MANSYISAYFHYVFSTKHRQPLIRPEFQKELWAYMGGIARKNNMKTISVGGTNDHIHILLSLPSTVTISKAIQLIKGNSSKWINESFENSKPFAWQKGYGAFSINVSILDATLRYIENQPKHHNHVSFQEEYISFLKKHKIEYDERYVWD